MDRPAVELTLQTYREDRRTDIELRGYAVPVAPPPREPVEYSWRPFLMRVASIACAVVVAVIVIRALQGH